MNNAFFPPRFDPTRTAPRAAYRLADTILYYVYRSKQVEGERRKVDRAAYQQGIRDIVANREEFTTVLVTDWTQAASEYFVWWHGREFCCVLGDSYVTIRVLVRPTEDVERTLEFCRKNLFPDGGATWDDDEPWNFVIYPKVRVLFSPPFSYHVQQDNHPQP